jgi:hypothetical protein
MVFRANKCRIRQKNSPSYGTKPHETTPNLGENVFKANKCRIRQKKCRMRRNKASRNKQKFGKKVLAAKKCRIRQNKRSHGKKTWRTHFTLGKKKTHPAK